MPLGNGWLFLYPKILMATNPMTLQSILDEIYVAVDNDPSGSTLNTSDDENVARVRLCNMAIRAWEREDVYWNELWTSYTHSSNVTTSTTYDLDADDFRFPGSYVKFTLNGSDTYLEVVKPEEGFKYATSGTRAVYFTGNHLNGYTLNLTWTPASGDGIYGSSIKFNYYKSAELLVNATDVPEMSDPEFIVNFVSYRKNLYNGRSNVSTDYLSAAQESMDNMRIKNEMRVHYGSSAIEDLDVIRHNASLGY